jgi:hypothetical protein
MVDAKLFKGKVKVLKSARAREAGMIDLEMQISAEEYREIKRRRDQQRSRYEQEETSRTSAHPETTCHILYLAE